MEKNKSFIPKTHNARLLESWRKRLKQERLKWNNANLRIINRASLEIKKLARYIDKKKKGITISTSIATEQIRKNTLTDNYILLNKWEDRLSKELEKWSNWDKFIISKAYQEIEKLKKYSYNRVTKEQTNYNKWITASNPKFKKNNTIANQETNEWYQSYYEWFWEQPKEKREQHINLIKNNAGYSTEIVWNTYKIVKKIQKNDDIFYRYWWWMWKCNPETQYCD